MPGTPAILGGTFGRGRFVLFSGHPEFHRKLGNNPLVVDAARWVIRGPLASGEKVEWRAVFPDTISEPHVVRGEVWRLSLDPTQGAEIKKTRPCVVLTHDTLNQLRRTIVVIPLSTAAKPHPPITVPVTCQDQPAVAATDQIRAVAKHRLKSKIEDMTSADLAAISRAVPTILEIR